MNLINCQNISMTYGEKNLFTEMNFSLDQGERIGIVGPNGAGKSTFLKILAGLIEPDEGKIVTRR